MLSAALASSDRATLKVAIDEAQEMLGNSTDGVGGGSAHPQPQLLRRAIKVFISLALALIQLPPDS